MFGRCSCCGSFGDVGPLLVPNGGQRLVCVVCADGWGPPRLPDRDRFRLLVQNLQEGSLAPSEERDLRFALDSILERSEGRSEAAHVLLEELLTGSMLSPQRARPPGSPSR